MAFGKLTLWYSCPAQGENGGKECKDSEKKQTEDCHFMQSVKVPVANRYGTECGCGSSNLVMVVYQSMQRMRYSGPFVLIDCSEVLCSGDPTDPQSICSCVSAFHIKKHLAEFSD